MKNKKWCFIVLIAVVGYSSCEKNKEGGFDIFFTVEDDKKLGMQVEKEILSNPAKYPVLDELKYPKAYQHLYDVRDKILASGKVLYKDEFLWKTRIIQNDSILNAFCAPGGYIFVYTGLIKYLGSEDEFAGVLGHEMGHADRRHTTDQLTKLYGVELLISVALGRDSSLLVGIAEQLAFLSFSRANEREADDLSVTYLYPTDYDARGAARFFEKLIASGQTGNTPTFLSTHPDPGDRVQAIIDKWRMLGGKVGKTFEMSYEEFQNSLP